jgi:hypothetical protein
VGVASGRRRAGLCRGRPERLRGGAGPRDRGGERPSERIVLTTAELLQAKQTCGWAAKAVQITFLDWYRTGLLAVGLRASGQYDYAVAVVAEDTGLRGVARSNDRCFIPLAKWADLTPVVVTFLYGPDCGQTELLNRALLVDQNGLGHSRDDDRAKGAAPALGPGDVGGAARSERGRDVPTERSAAAPGDSAR